jgi:transposase
MKPITREEFGTIYRAGEDVVFSLICKLIDENTQLRLRIEILENRLSLNSHNSSKPPSSDGYQKPNPKSLRTETRRTGRSRRAHAGAE